MSYRTDQHYIVRRGRRFHFVSYDACPANPKTGQVAMPASWFLMNSGKRWPVIGYHPDEDPEAVVAALTRWLDENVFSGPASPDPSSPQKTARTPTDPASR